MSSATDISSYSHAVAPEFTQVPMDTNVTSFEGDIILMCGGMGFPIPNITWIQNGYVIDMDQDNTTINTTSSNSSRTTLSILTVSMAMVNNSGFYHCNLSSLDFEDLTSEVALILVQSK